MLISLLIWNILIFGLYGFDKRQAIKGKRRVSEKTLLSLSFLLGGLGALFAGYYFHHKTRKWYFLLTWYLGSGLLLLVIYLIWLGP